MRAGLLRHRMTLQSYNAATGVWEDMTQIYAELEPGAAANDGAAMDYVVSTRWCPQLGLVQATSELKPTHRLLWGARELQIFEVTNVGQRGREARLSCREMPATAEVE